MGRGNPRTRRWTPAPDSGGIPQGAAKAVVRLSRVAGPQPGRSLSSSTVSPPARAAIAEQHRRGGSHRHWFAPDSGGWRSKVKVLTALLSLFPGVVTAPVLPCPHVAFPLCLVSLSIRTAVSRIGPHPEDLNYLLKDPVSSRAPFGVRASECELGRQRDLTWFLAAEHTPSIDCGPVLALWHLRPPFCGWQPALTDRLLWPFPAPRDLPLPGTRPPTSCCPWRPARALLPPRESL